jgi:hypothetical protein
MEQVISVWLVRQMRMDAKSLFHAPAFMFLTKIKLWRVEAMLHEWVVGVATRQVASKVATGGAAAVQISDWELRI